jgi:hypothetical protein
MPPGTEADPTCEKCKKCTHWRGHKFEPRYSSTPTPGVSIGKETGSGRAAIDAMLRFRCTVTYERDVCVRCGATIEKHGG